MELLFHTIVVEPARWTPQRTSQTLTAILPDIAAAGFHRIEVFEPHLTAAATSREILEAFRSLKLSPEILSSYLNLNPVKTSPEQLDAGIEEIRARINFYGFRRVRIFPGAGMSPSDTSAVSGFTKGLEHLASGLPDVEILLETHDGSLADDPATITQIVRDLGAPTVGLLYQPTFFEPEKALRQFELQRPFIRHVHLQNRHLDLSFATLRDGVIPWPRILGQLDKTVTATLEFTPAGICPLEKFDLAATLREAQSEAAYISGIWNEAA